MKGLTSLFSVYQSVKGSVLGDRVAEWPARRTRNPDVPLLSHALALAGFVLGCSEFKSSATFVKSQLVAFCQLGFLIILLRYISIICF